MHFCTFIRSGVLDQAVRGLPPPLNLQEEEEEGSNGHIAKLLPLLLMGTTPNWVIPGSPDDSVPGSLGYWYASELHILLYMIQRSHINAGPPVKLPEVIALRGIVGVPWLHPPAAGPLCTCAPGNSTTHPESCSCWSRVMGIQSLSDSKILSDPPPTNNSLIYGNPNKSVPVHFCIFCTFLPVSLSCTNC